MRDWTLVSWHCEPRPGNVPETGRIVIETSWNREDGLAVDASGALSADGQSANHSRETSLPFGPPVNIDVLPPTAAYKNTWMFMQEHGLILCLTDLLPSSVQADKDALPPDPWIQVMVDFTLAAPPWLDLAVASDVVPGLRVVDLGYGARAQ